MPKIIKNNTVYAAVPSSANGIAYSGTTSGISANTVQGAIDEVVEEKADRVPEPEEYDSTATYDVGDFVTYNGGIYRCKTTISTAEAWDSTHWTLVTPDADYLHSINPNGNGSFSLNRKSDTTIGNCSFAEGYNATASGNCSHSEGVITKATGDYSHAEGYSTTASGSYSHAEGSRTTASGISSHTEGQSTNASGDYSHTEGYNTTASGNNSHAEGYHTTSSAYATHSEGFSTQATTDYAHSEGASTEATGQSSHAEGSNTIANHRSQHVFGEYNVADPITSTKTKYMKGDYVEIVGNGTADNARSNARTLDWNGNEILAGGLTCTNVNGGKPISYCMVTNSDGRYYKCHYSIKGSYDRIPVLIVHGHQTSGSIYAPECVSLCNNGTIKIQSGGHVTCTDYNITIDQGSSAWAYCMVIYPPDYCTVENGHI